MCVCVLEQQPQVAGRLVPNSWGGESLGKFKDVRFHPILNFGHLGPTLVTFLTIPNVINPLHLHTKHLLHLNTYYTWTVWLLHKAGKDTVDRVLCVRMKMMKNEAKGPADSLVTEIQQCLPTEKRFEKLLRGGVPNSGDVENSSAGVSRETKR